MTQNGLQRAVGQCIYERIKIFPPLLSTPAGSVLRTNARTITTTFPSKLLQLSLNQTEIQNGINFSSLFSKLESFIP